MNDSYKEVTVVLVSHKSKKKVLDLIKKISNNFKIIIVENSYDKSIENIISDLHKNIQIIFSENNGYGSAINLARTHVATKYFFVLNPDMQKIDDNLINVFYESAKELNDSIDKTILGLYLLTNCKHYVVTGSSFNWWGAWLSANQNKIIIRPSNFKNFTFNNKDLWPENWLSV